MAPIKEAIITGSSMVPTTISPPMVLATPVLIIAPRKFNTAAIIIALLGDMALVDTEVAIALAVSWKPLIKSNIKASNTTIIIKG